MATCPAEQALTTFKGAISKMIALDPISREMLNLDFDRGHIFLRVSVPTFCTLCKKEHPLMFIEQAISPDNKGVVAEEPPPPPRV